MIKPFYIVFSQVGFQRRTISPKKTQTHTHRSKKLNGFYFSFMLIIKNFSFLRHSIKCIIRNVVCIMHAKIDNVKTFYIFHVHGKSLCSHSVSLSLSQCVLALVLSLFTIRCVYVCLFFSVVIRFYRIFSLWWLSMCSVHAAFLATFENDFIFLSAFWNLNDIVLYVCPALSTDLLIVLACVYFHYILDSLHALLFRICSVYSVCSWPRSTAARTFGIYYNLKHDPLFWLNTNRRKNSSGWRGKKKKKRSERVEKSEQTREKKSQKKTKMEKCTRVLYDVQSVYMLCMSNTQIFYYYQL